MLLLTLISLASLSFTLGADSQIVQETHSTTANPIVSNSTAYDSYYTNSVSIEVGQDYFADEEQYLKFTLSNKISGDIRSWYGVEVFCEMNKWSFDVSLDVYKYNRVSSQIVNKTSIDEHNLYIDNLLLRNNSTTDVYRFNRLDFYRKNCIFENTSTAPFTQCELFTFSYNIYTYSPSVLGISTNSYQSGYESGYDSGYTDGINNNDKYNQGYSEGYDVGKVDGVNEFLDSSEYSDALSDANSDGFQVGRAVGYAEGVEASGNVAHMNAIFTGILDVGLMPVNFFLKILNFEVFGINIGGFVTGLFTLSIVVMLFRMFFGSNGGKSE